MEVPPRFGRSHCGDGRPRTQVRPHQLSDAPPPPELPPPPLKPPPPPSDDPPELPPEYPPPPPPENPPPRWGGLPRPMSDANEPPAANAPKAAIGWRMRIAIG